MKDIELNAIAAMCNQNRGIGKDNKLPWSLPNEFQYFERVMKTNRDETKVNALITGRLNWISMGSKPFDSKNLYFIISSKITMAQLENELSKSEFERIILCKSIEQALEQIKMNYSSKVETIYAIGGVEIYRSAVQSPFFNRFYLTRVLENFECDVFLQPENFLENFTKLESKTMEIKFLF